MSATYNTRIAIIGAGPLGISVGYELQQKGFSDFTLLEASDAVGGTWHTHSYPGLACDVWAHSYTFPFARNPDWSASFVDQPEIEAYIQKTAEDIGLTPHIRLNAKVIAAKYDPLGKWVLTIEGGERFECEVLINCMGNQFTPLMPKVAGLVGSESAFKGPSWHSTHWNHDVDLTGKRVAVIGSAAAAVQIVPEVAKLAEHLTVLQRTPNWIMPRNKKPYSDFQRRLFKRLPVLNRALIASQGFLMNLVHDATTFGHKRMGQFEGVAQKYIERTIKDPELKAAVTPNTPYGCKRPLVSDDYYPALNRENVSLIASGLKEVTGQGFITDDGQHIDVDVIIYCTGYQVQDFDRIEIIGEQDKNLAAAMNEAPEAYKGLAVPGFPNFFFGMGPNGVCLTVSYFISAELNAKAIVKLLIEKEQAGHTAISAKPALSREYNDWMLERFPRFSWGAPSCNSYYQTASGHVPFLYPDKYKLFKKEREQISLKEFDAF